MDQNDLAADPLAQLEAWLAEARATAPLADAMALATADVTGRPSVRMVLLRGVDARGIRFFTNRNSRKGRELRENPRAAAAVHWWELGRQVRVEGPVEELSEAESQAYWYGRPRGSQIAAWASPQSEPLSGRGELDTLVAAADARFAGRDVPLPPFWGAYRVVADTVELWQHRDSRLHDRFRYEHSAHGWTLERLAP